MQLNWLLLAIALAFDGLFMAAVIFLPKGLMGFVRPAVARMLSREPKP